MAAAPVFFPSSVVVSVYRAHGYAFSCSSLLSQLPAIKLSSYRPTRTDHTAITLLPNSNRIASRLQAMQSPTFEVNGDGKTEEVEKLQKGIAEFYDESSGIWEEIWGDHMHHGFYDPGTTVSLADHRTAQIRMIEEALRFASVSDDPMKKPKRIVDVGCGIGGSSRYFARKYDAECKGITLSPVQAKRAQALAVAEGLQGTVSFEVADALAQPFPHGQFDLVWSMESGEHMPDKEKFVRELVRVAAPGATIIIVTWCHRDLSPSEHSLKPQEQKLLNKICDSYYLPAWCSTADYVKILESLFLEDIKRADWSEYVAPFWPAVIRSALTWKGFTSLIRSGWKTIKGAMVMPLMIEGFKKDVIKFSVITCRKPE
ncbi:hypothetical protein M9H77_12852 [Catharanthus roseus]|uniref:Gamma-tocopherol methyltransferase, chloroplastic n=2 Tax=Catharanthus roseus TaxID=4058 RepID=TMT3_CATRO|nr:RecName: Full=Gamma-tocopherol methyltransferase, chloroplastic; Short=pCrgammaTMT; AltName: Full=Gamma-tocopherol-like methyltransferase 3; AltName: Full=Picrinine-N-methytransferase TMT3; Flags: Precursor [Catharanthus roseus]KAI5672488.1 hypothetical protein M9H77_12852 [Catharanthus roseus]URY10633.1 gamma-tocopherol methyltransferase [Catharanthus roseus]